MIRNGRRRARSSGFSLIELAIVLVIIGLLIGGGVVALQATTERQQRSEERRQMEQVRDALYGFAMANGHLPCADTDEPPNGQQNRNGEQCASGADRGALPWATLGVGERDAWGHRLYYAVDPEYARQPEEGAGAWITFDSEPDLSVESSVTDPDAVTLASSVVAVVVSFGGQGGQVWTENGFECPVQGFSDDERENCNGSDPNLFVSGPYRGADSSLGRFDDIVTWIPDSVFKARLVQAGRLP